MDIENLDMDAMHTPVKQNKRQISMDLNLAEAKSANIFQEEKLKSDLKRSFLEKGLKTNLFDKPPVPKPPMHNTPVMAPPSLNSSFVSHSQSEVATSIYSSPEQPDNIRASHQASVF